MASERYVLDTSAIFTSIENEDWAQRVEQILRQGEIFLWSGQAGTSSRI